mmetsp:Transcript_33085/g.65174  ORF Transcript_33085/g.65174 Transcript_33085/m.65174 type:complete len:1471 (+) Transcript_33085:56-4468(+)
MLCKASLEAFEAYAMRLHGLLGSLEVVSEVLALLLECYGSCAPAMATATNHKENGENVVNWCLSCDGLQRPTPAAISRALLLRIVAQACGGAADTRCVEKTQFSNPWHRLLAAVPVALVEAPEPLAVRLAETAAAFFGGSKDGDASAASWLQTLSPPEAGGDSEDVLGATRTYAHIAGALLVLHPKGDVHAAAWEVTERIMTSPKAAERKVCMQRLLPRLVSATEETEAAERLANFIDVQLSGMTRGGIADALALGVSFHQHLLRHWRLSSFAGDHSDVGLNLIATGLRLGLKECASLRKQARFLLEMSVREALVDAGAESAVKSIASIDCTGMAAAWRSFWELFDAVEDYSSHLLKSSWEALMTRLINYMRGLKEDATAPRWSPAVLAPLWLEVFFARAFNHDNDSVQRFVLGQVLALDQGAMRLSETFVLGQMLPRFSHRIETLFPQTDLQKSFERQVTTFFSAFVRCHARGPAWAARRLLLAIMDVEAVHYTPLRLVFEVLLQVDTHGALTAETALEVLGFFFSSILTKTPISVRRNLASLAVCTVTRLCEGAPAGDCGGDTLVQRVAETVASVPDNLLDELQDPLAALAKATLGPDAMGHSTALLRALADPGDGACSGLSAVETLGRSVTPMVAVQLVLGIVRLLWSLGAKSNGDNQRLCSSVVLPAIAPTLHNIHRRPYIPRRAKAAAVFSYVYACALLPDGSATLEQQVEIHTEMLAYVEVHHAEALGHGSASGVIEESSWMWLHALLLRALWQASSSCVGGGADGILESSAAVINNHLKAVTTGEPQEVLVTLAAASALAAVAPKLDIDRRARLFVLLWRCHLPRARGVEVRFDVNDDEGLGHWQRNRLEEHYDLHRVDREGLGRTLEWRDTMAVFLVAKWRALASLACLPGLITALGKQPPAEQQAGAPVFEEPWPHRFGLALLAELETLQPPHIAFWAMVVRRVAFPLVFTASVAEDRQREMLHALCSGLRGTILEATGDSSTYMPQGCMAELAATLCDPLLLEAERRLFPPTFCEQSSAESPLTEAVRRLLAVGEVSVGVSRCVVAPLLASLLRPSLHSNQGDSHENPSEAAAAELMVALLLHQEATIPDGAAQYAPNIAAGVVDSDGPGGNGSLAAVCPRACELGRKFGGTPGLTRILTLAALDCLAERSSCDGNPRNERTTLPTLVLATLHGLLAALRRALEHLLRPPSSRRHSPARPPTPMPMSSTHRMQLRAWQAVLVLGAHADRATAKFLVAELFFHLSVTHVPDVREYQELLGCVLCGRFPDLAVEPLLVPALKQFDAAVQVSASLLIIVGYLFRTWAASPKEALRSQPERITALVLATVPYLSHNAAYVRGCAAWAYQEMVSAVGPESFCAHAGGSIDATLIQELQRFQTENRECQKMRGRLKLVFTDFEPGPRSILECLVDRSLVLQDVSESSQQQQQQQQQTELALPPRGTGNIHMEADAPQLLLQHQALQ